MLLKKLILLMLYCGILCALPLSAQTMQNNTPETQHSRQLEQEIDSLNRIIEQLRADKNHLLDKSRRLDAQRATMGAVLTLVSFFLVLFAFMYLAARSRRKREGAAWKAKFRELQQNRPEE